MKNEIRYVLVSVIFYIHFVEERTYYQTTTKVTKLSREALKTTYKSLVEG